MLIELKKGYWVSCDDYLDVDGLVGCIDVDCVGDNNITCDDCIFNNGVKLALEDVAIKQEENLQELFIDCTEEELKEIRGLLRAKGYSVF